MNLGPDDFGIRSAHIPDLDCSLIGADIKGRKNFCFNMSKLTIHWSVKLRKRFVTENMQ